MRLWLHLRRLWQTLTFVATCGTMGHTFSRTTVQMLTVGPVTTIPHTATSTHTRGAQAHTRLRMEAEATGEAAATAVIHTVATAMAALVFNVFRA
ncbi:hypothetical protein DBA26_13715 [Brucella canis]|uniref:Uncharacterized protein n=3 Tax=Brucella TaxID=234 RepID=A9M7U9_BRUC2|nr:hypothetical protein BR0263 [Brucella suis 1330]ABX61359.1 Hypothetical protein, conserved [Brucella canis ATCC 23365]ABY37381.1 Hypothetical protein, conserved [Brucella suis ATCC 23445]AEU05293.1 hypothetical protein BSVBI22_A0264 [Brucella suis VBI22]AHN45921.1 hypothetical protein BSS2_I0259 [Brucella suis bv. 1 str. S2]RXX13217.1 hypothetical protein DBA26_13715 [Brucella canis]CDL75678.1 unnamed protein product [Brucella canis str. Oliveri]